MNIPYTFSDQELAWIQAASFLISTIAMLISVSAIYFTVKSYKQKRGNYIRGTYSINMSQATEDCYVSNLILENMKDKPIVIFGIYLRLSTRVTLEIEDCSDSPIILKSFEALNKKYDPVHFYGFNGSQVNVNKLFSDRLFKNKLILATTDGKLIVRKPIPIWKPHLEMFKNPLRIALRPIRRTYHGRGYGSNPLYIVILYEGSKVKQAIPIHPTEHYLAWFDRIGGTEASLSSTSTISELFHNAVSAGKIEAESIEVIDAKEDSRSIYNFYRNKVTLSDEPSWFVVNIIGRWKGSRIRRKMRKSR